MRAAALCALAALAVGCEGQVGVIDLRIVTAPGADPLADVQRLRLTLSNPRTVTESERGADGSFSLEIDAIAEGQSARVSLAGFDADGDLVASGKTAILPISSIDASVAIYVAAPDSVAESPVTLDVARAHMATGQLSFGSLWAGGTDADGAPTDAVTIYNVYTHELQIGLALPEPRTRMTAAAGQFSFVYLFGGEDEAGADTATFWRFDTSAAPNGSYLEFVSNELFARAGAAVAPIASEAFLIGGDPAIVLDGTTTGVTDAQAPPLDGPMATLLFDPVEVVILAAGAGVGGAGAVVLRNGAFIDVAEPPAEVARTDHAVVGLRNGDGLIVGGSLAGTPTATAVRFRIGDNGFTVLDDFLQVPRNNPAVARAEDRIVVAGGTDASGALVPSVEIFDATTLAPVATVPMVVPRTMANAVAFDNGQIALAGGFDESGAPSDVIELFTP